MKGNFLKRSLLSSCMLASLLTTTAIAQDTYWFLNDNINQGQTSYLNTSTRSAVTYNGFANYYSGAHPRTVYDASGNEVFSYGTAQTSQSSQFITQGGSQAFRIPGKCKQYYLMTVSRNLPHLGAVSFTLIDASGGGLPVVGNPVLMTNLGSGHYGAVAARLEPDGRRYIYCLSSDPAGYCNLYRFTIKVDGSFGPSNVYDVIATGLPWCPENVRMKMAPDGNSLGYTDVNGRLVTVKDLTTSTPGVTSYNKTALGMAEATVGGVRRWYVSTGSELGYFTEGNNTTFTTISNSSTGSYGINSDIAQSWDGYIYVAKGNPVSGAGTLTYFSPSVTSPVFNIVSGALVSGVNDVNTPTAYSFGSSVEGEDVNKPQPTTWGGFNVNNVYGSTSPTDIWVCPGAINLQLNATMSQYARYSFSYQFGTYNNGIFTGTGAITSVGPTSGPFSPYSIPLSSLPTYIRVSFNFHGVCGDTVSQTCIFGIKPLNILVNFKMIGPNDGDGNAVCPNGTQNRYTSTTFQTIGAVTTPSCWPGWLGAFTVGVASPSLSGGTVQATPPLKITVQEYDTNMNFIQTIINTNYINIPLTYPFNRPNNGYYFSSNYSTIKNNNIYKVIVGILSNECGVVTNSSYFKIIDGGAAGSPNFPESWKQAPGSQGGDLQLPEVFPNPVATTLSIKIPAATTQASVQIMDNMGRLVAEKQDLQVGRNSIDVQRLPAGVYFYNLSVDGKVQHGKVIKQ